MEKRVIKPEYVLHSKYRTMHENIKQLVSLISFIYNQHVLILKETDFINKY